MLLISALILASCHEQHEAALLDASAKASVTTWAVTTCSKQDHGRVLDMTITRDDATTPFGGPFLVSIHGCGFIIENTPWFARLGDQQVGVGGDTGHLGGFLAREPAVGEELWLGLDNPTPTGIRYAGLG